MYCVQVLSTEEINKYFSSTNKLPHTYKYHLQVTNKTVKNSQMKPFAHFFCSNEAVLAQIEQK